MARKPHVVCVPYPTTSQINPILALAKLLHSKGFFITFVNTETIHRKILRSQSIDALKDSSPRFRFQTIPDGYSSSDPDGPLNVGKLYVCVKENCAAPLAELLRSYGSAAEDGSIPPVSCVVSSFLATFACDVAGELGIPLYMFWSNSPMSLLGDVYLPELVRRGYLPLKDDICLTNGYLDSPIDWITGMKDIRLRDLSSFIRTTNPDDLYLNAEISHVNLALKASGVIVNNFAQLDSEVLDSLRISFSDHIYSIGPLPAMIDEEENQMKSLSLNLRKDDRSCIEWLDSQEEASVVYVSFGSLAILTAEQLTEFAWGLAESNFPFLWIVRTDLLAGGGGRAALEEEFIRDTEGRSFLVDWCPQEEVLSHPAVGGFLMHAGWNSMMESIFSCVPMICWPGFADQYTNSHYACKKWGIALEIAEEVKREQVRDRIKEMMEGEKAEEMRGNAEKWKEMAGKATKNGGTSFLELERLAKDIKSCKIRHGS